MIDITVAEIKGMTNLDQVEKDTLIEAHKLIVDYKLSRIIEPDIYNTTDESIIYTLKFAFSSLMYAEIMPLLNVNTAGSGIVKSTGMMESKVDLISQEELTKRINQAELKAFQVLEPYLSDYGKKRYEKLQYWDELFKIDVENIEAKTAVISAQSKVKKFQVKVI